MKRVDFCLFMIYVYDVSNHFPTSGNVDNRPPAPYNACCFFVAFSLCGVVCVR